MKWTEGELPPSGTPFGTVRIRRNLAQETELAEVACALINVQQGLEDLLGRLFDNGGVNFAVLKAIEEDLGEALPELIGRFCVVIGVVPMEVIASWKTN